ncbi:hypothetical protein [Paenisporosarcina antarctica]|uniref:Uncharacterized protein n=1 Tax=Paenisporosarcina antarctica TaxID=417367 RepID=A0A4P7A2B6_9BACL|nr:hypothetical protein [Paenisporosarcina antarctica]QBP42798.1 hypothetical protein E2636_17365 [Paenisporosarcina antarctica]
MLTFFDKYQSLILSIILAFYILNSIYIGSSYISFTLFFFVILMQLIRMRKQIKQLSFLQLVAIFGILIASLVGLVLIFMGFNHLLTTGVLYFPDWLIVIIQIVLILVFLLSVTSAIRNLYERFTRSKE